ncbi:MAG TPA: porin family protein [Cyclobacteriaceae bacterium]|nr:porin family protein [Cyclobacteriaceae bacterium]
MNYRRLLPTVVLVASVAACYAQSMSIGAKGGLNFTRISNAGISGSPSSGFWARYHVGIFGNFKFSKFTLQPEILYSRQGTKDPDATGQPRINLEYASIPVLFKWELTKGFNIQAGPQFSILARAALEVESNGSVASTDLEDNLHKYDWALCTGFGWESPFGLVVDARYNIPITDLNKLSGVEMHNQVIQLSAGYKLFKFGK